MTALKPIENMRVHGVSAQTYPINAKCAHPECNEPIADPHHCFPRSEIAGNSWFVRIEHDTKAEAEALALPLGLRVMLNVSPESGDITYMVTIPHVAGLCRAHHDAVEVHVAWIKLEDGVFVWYDRAGTPYGQSGFPDFTWERLGPLNPQPGSREGKPKRRKFQGEKRRVRKTLSFRVPEDAQEDMAGTIDDGLEQLEELLGHDPPRTRGYTLADAVNFALMWVRDEQETHG